MSLKSLSFAAAALLFLSSAPVLASEVSLISGIYQASSTETNNDNKVGDTTLEFGGRYSTDAVNHSAWLIEGLLRTTKHEAPKGSADPDDDNSFAVGGGWRYFFANMSEKVRPLFQARAGLKNETNSETSVVTSGTTTTTNTVKHEKTSLYYAADGGFRFDVSPDFFYEIECPFFESSIYSVEKETTGEGASKTDTKTRGMDLYVKTYSPLTSARFSVGMRF